MTTVGSTQRWVSFDELLAEPPWPLARELALPGRCRGALLRDWAAHVERRAGSAMVDRLRQHLGLDAIALPAAPKADAWYPVAYQVALTRAIVDLSLGGDLRALEPLLAEDASRLRDRLVELALRALGPRRLLAKTAKIHQHLYDVGVAAADARDGSVRLDFSGAALFGNPTWRVLQVFAMRGMLRGFGRTVTELTADVGRDDRLILDLAWK